MKYFIVLFLLVTQTTPGYAADTALPDDFPELRQMLAKMVPNSKPDRITPTPADGLYEVVYGTHIFYATKDGRYMINGDIIDVPAHSNITEGRRSGVRMNAINKISEDKMIIFAPAKVKAHYHRVYRYRLRLLPQAAQRDRQLPERRHPGTVSELPAQWRRYTVL